MAQWRHVWPSFYHVFDRMRWRMVDSVVVLSFLGHRLSENGADRYKCARQAGCNDFPSFEHLNS